MNHYTMPYKYGKSTRPGRKNILFSKSARFIFFPVVVF